MPGPWPTFPILGTRLVSEFRGDFNDIITGMLTAFVGVDEPTPKYAGQFWVDTSTTPKLLKQRNSLNTVWIVRARVDQDWGGLLPLVGGTMEGAINMGGFGITNLPAGSGAAPARYSDLAPYAKLDGTTPFTGIPSGPAMDPSLANQFARKSYVDAKAIAGGTFTGKITMPFAPVAGSNELARIIDVENPISTHNHSGAAGQGVKIPVASISPTGGAAGDGPRHNGSGVVWGAEGVLADAPGLVTIWDTTAAIGITTFDLSVYVPTFTRMAILQLTFQEDGTGYFTVDLRRTGSTNFYTYRADIRSQALTGLRDEKANFVFQVFQYLDTSRRLDYRVNFTSFGASDPSPAKRSICKLVGYL